MKKNQFNLKVIKGKFSDYCIPCSTKELAIEIYKYIQENMGNLNIEKVWATDNFVNFNYTKDSYHKKLFRVILEGDCFGCRRDCDKLGCWKDPSYKKKVSKI